MSDTTFEFVFEVKKNDFSSSITKEKPEKKKKKEITDEEKVTATKRLSDKILNTVYYDMLLAIPVLIVGAGIGLYNIIKGLVEKLLAGKKNIGEGDGENTNSTEFGDTKSVETPTGGVEETPEVKVTKPNPITTGDIDVGPVLVPDKNGEYNMTYNVDVSFSTNADEATDFFDTINKTDMTAPINEWATEFESSANKEKRIVENSLTAPFKELNTVLDSIKNNKATVDKYLKEIRHWEKKIKKAEKKKKENGTVSIVINPPSNNPNNPISQQSSQNYWVGPTYGVSQVENYGDN